jgi:hypothetical protein
MTQNENVPRPPDSLELARQMHNRLSVAMGELRDLLNDYPSQLEPAFGVARDATGKWFVTHVQVNVKA